MNILSRKLLHGFLAGAVCFSACGDGENANQNANQTVKANKNTILAKDDTEELGKIIKLPFTPEETTWHEENLNTKNTGNRIPAPGEKKLTVVLKFSKEDTKRIVAGAEKHKPATPAELDAESWFPPELVAKSLESGDETLKGASYPANDFFQTPYNSGKLIHISDTDYFVLELFSM